MTNLELRGKVQLPNCEMIEDYGMEADFPAAGRRRLRIDARPTEDVTDNSYILIANKDVQGEEREHEQHG